MLNNQLIRLLLTLILTAYCIIPRIAAFRILPVGTDNRSFAYGYMSWKFSRASYNYCCSASDDTDDLTAARSAGQDGKILRRVDKWACIRNCGACCKLGPVSSRPELQSYLTTEEYELYNSMIGADDWCKHFNKETRMCSIYETRPSFCRVDPKTFQRMFGVAEDELNDFCAFCCREQISDVYGDDSTEMNSFEEVLQSIQDQ